MSRKRRSWLSKIPGIKQNESDGAEGVWISEAKTPPDWKMGDTIVNLYEVMNIHSSGAMGLVYHVYHRGWNIDLAVKSPRPEYFQNKNQEQNFIRECETWINLGLHPNTVSCYYVRTLGGIPRVFAEYIEGGSLQDWIKSRKLYEGERNEVLKRILEISIQFAWGLQYAHEKGIVHQDIKPANVMMTLDGTPKITDFGLAKARSMTSEVTRRGLHRSILVSSGGMTLAYCSPEQAQIDTLKKAETPLEMLPKLTRRTDIWSWGLSILEMFAGEVFWKAGQVAPEALKEYLKRRPGKKVIPSMPQGLADLLAKCFQFDPNDRPKNMSEILSILLDIYNVMTYFRYSKYAFEEPRPINLTADDLNNQAISMLDLGRKREAMKLLERALEISPKHKEATYNHGLALWRSAQINDIELIRRINSTKQSTYSYQDEWKADYLLGHVHLERGDVESATEVLQKALALTQQPILVKRALKTAKNKVGNRKRIIMTFPIQLGRDIDLRRTDLTSIVVNEQFNCVILCVNTIIEVWDLTKGKFIHRLDSQSMSSVAISPNGEYGLFGFYEDLKLWEFRTRKWLGTFVGHIGNVTSVVISPDSKYGLSGSNDGTIKLWELTTGKCLRTFEGHTGRVYSIAISPDGKLVFSVSNDRILKLWELKSGRLLRNFRVGPAHINCVTFSPDGKYMLSGHSKARCILRELKTGKVVRTFRDHRGAISSVAVSPDGKLALSVDCNANVKIWDLETGKCIRTYQGMRSVKYADFGGERVYICTYSEFGEPYLKSLCEVHDLGYKAGYAPSKIK